MSKKDRHSLLVSYIRSSRVHYHNDSIDTEQIDKYIQHILNAFNEQLPERIMDS